MSSLRTLYDVACPFCGAGFGSFCTVAIGAPNAGKPLVVPHVARRTAFRIAKASEPVRPGA